MARKGIILVSALLLGGCLSPVRERVDQEICHKAELPVDLDPRTPAMAAALAADAAGSPSFEMDSGLRQAAAQADIKPKTDMVKRLRIPQDVPGSDAPDIKLPLPTAPRKEIDEAINRQFLQLGPLGAAVKAAPGPDGRPLTLADLQKLALSNHWSIRQAAAAVEAARGGAWQARLYPNPVVGLSYASMGPGGGPINLGTVSGVIKGPGKIKLAFDAANVDVKTAELALRKAESDLRTTVRDNYFALLSAKENLRVNRAMVKLTDEVYQVLKEQLSGGTTSTYETMQLRVVANQTRMQLLMAHNRYLAAWKQLAASLGLPGMPLTEVAGRIDSPLPKYVYDKVLAQVLTSHTDVLTAKMVVEKARSLVGLAKLTPYPDFIYTLGVGEDNSPGAAPFKTIGTLTFGVPLPIFDRNQGGIQQAQGNLLSAIEESHRVRSALTQNLADAFERYENTRIQMEMYRKDMLPNQIQAFRATVLRHAKGPVGDVMFTDLVTAEQSLVSLVTSYLGVLHDMWFAAVDIAGLLQTPDLFQVDESLPVAPIPDLEHLFPLECQHPCPVLPNPALRGGDGYWPSYDVHTEPEKLHPPREVPGRQNSRPSRPMLLPEQIENAPSFLAAPMDTPPT